MAGAAAKQATAVSKAALSTIESSTVLLSGALAESAAIAVAGTDTAVGSVATVAKATGDSVSATGAAAATGAVAAGTYVAASITKLFGGQRTGAGTGVAAAKEASMARAETDSGGAAEAYASSSVAAEDKATTSDAAVSDLEGSVDAESPRRSGLVPSAEAVAAAAVRNGARAAVAAEKNEATVRGDLKVEPVYTEAVASMPTITDGAAVSSRGIGNHQSATDAKPDEVLFNPRSHQAADGNDFNIRKQEVDAMNLAKCISEDTIIDLPGQTCGGVRHVQGHPNLLSDDDLSGASANHFDTCDDRHAAVYTPPRRFVKELERTSPAKVKDPKLCPARPRNKPSMQHRASLPSRESSPRKARPSAFSSPELERSGWHVHRKAWYDRRFTSSEELSTRKRDLYRQKSLPELRREMYEAIQRELDTGHDSDSTVRSPISAGARSIEPPMHFKSTVHKKNSPVLSPLSMDTRSGVSPVRHILSGQMADSRALSPLSMCAGSTSSSSIRYASGRRHRGMSPAEEGMRRMYYAREDPFEGARLHPWRKHPLLCFGCSVRCDSPKASPPPPHA
eukprot:gnl/TRDRNA2_/TRDRNA2_87198_c0_seq1.p1 gnl/TRDRNA2_/TRDRNA2_87198_c0~~gnl/TRDRNA2_/TRDRNA2_87198_c0_seq1.p1  ORF type:complete len:581 (-),score=90.67 gnl/TRDRNA2_/TRDRNA2_87198_c0_seq1:19-1716(-)